MLEGLRLRLASALLPKQTGGGTDLDQQLYSLLLNRNPPRRGTHELIRSYKEVPYFRAVVSKIADHVAAVRWRAYKVVNPDKSVNPKGKARRTRAGYINDPIERRKVLAAYRKSGELVELEDHVLTKLLDYANPLISGFASRRITQVWLDVVGEAFWSLGRNAMGAPFTYYPLPPNWIKTTPTIQKPFFEVQVRGKSRQIEPQDMIWFRDLDPVNPYGRGSGLGEALGDEIDTVDYAAKYVKSFFYNSGKPDVIIGVEGAGEDALKEAKQKMEDQSLGFARAHRVHWTSGKLTVKELNAKFDKMQIVDLKGAYRNDFVNTYGIPPEILGIIAGSNRATIREALRLFASETIVPRCERLREEQQRALVSQLDDRIIIDYDSPVPVDDLAESTAAKDAPHMLTRGEWRVRQGEDDRGEVDNVHFVPVNLMTQAPGDAVGDPGEPATQPKAQ